MKIVIDGKTAEVLGGASQEIYSTEETRIGTWIDGKPVYSKTVAGLSPDHYGVWTVIGSILDISEVISLNGIILAADNVWCPIPYVSTITGSEPFITCTAVFPNGDVSVYAANPTFYSRPARVTVKYTKATDTAPVNTLSSETLVSSKVELPTVATLNRSNYNVTYPSTVTYADASASNAISIATGTLAKFRI